MNRFEQIDAFTFEVENAIDVTDTKLKLCDSIDEGNSIIEDFVSQLNSYTNRYMIEFDLTTYDIIGALEMIKYDFTVNDNLAVEILGAMEFIKVSILVDSNIVFESEPEIDLEDLDELDLEDL